ncbi:MAG: AMP-binding protein [Actinomycetota bacterium]|nr:AMP-binding protein [Actinomycetota bacterium]
MIFESPFPQVDVPEAPFSPFVLEHAADRGDKGAIIDGPSGRTITYGELSDTARAVAAGLSARGFRKGDVFAVFCPNSPEYAVGFLAVAMLGGIITPINPLYKPSEVGYQLRDARARWLLTVPECLDRALEATGDSAVHEVFVLGEAPGATSFERSAIPGGLPPDVAIDPHGDLLVLPYSSGTTGLPKGVMLTHHNLVANVSQVCLSHRVVPKDVILGILPFFHIYGMTVVMSLALRNGATVVTMPRFDLESFLRILETYRVTRAPLVPPIILALAKDPRVGDFDLSNLKVIMSGAAPLGSDLAEACARRLDCRVVQGYGLTEASPVTHCTPEAPAINKPGSIGPLLAGTQARVVDVSTGADLGTDEAGELFIRGPQVMRGYLNDPVATSAMIDPEGWLHTGDLARADSDGYFTVVDRLKELIKYKGFQVAPAELEALLLTHPNVGDAAVVAAFDEEAGEVPVAFIVMTAGPRDQRDILGFVAARVAPHKRLHGVRFVEEIPKSPSGKILRRHLKELV